jgi:hypothetical protein
LSFEGVAILRLQGCDQLMSHGKRDDVKAFRVASRDIRVGDDPQGIEVEVEIAVDWDNGQILALGAADRTHVAAPLFGSELAAIVRLYLLPQLGRAAEQGVEIDLGIALLVP